MGSTVLLSSIVFVIMEVRNRDVRLFGFGDKVTSSWCPKILTPLQVHLTIPCLSTAVFEALALEPNKIPSQFLDNITKFFVPTAHSTVHTWDVILSPNSWFLLAPLFIFNWTLADFSHETRCAERPLNPILSIL
ncbi:hypothetical protein M413DRAFT_156174 [Hebeloma cylindrosporum]|uniref:Uncharacterized protein n=1 Tax=Hebeloma cylindrosporum TaxID=76867 RepID=A0A0C2XTB2_HEBCY|nr:hypothetical protein M413DRAFT_156174 [Hebeloma cylindrosporum h7]